MRQNSQIQNMTKLQTQHVAILKNSKTQNVTKLKIQIGTKIYQKK